MFSDANLFQRMARNSPELSRSAGSNAGNVPDPGPAAVHSDHQNQQQRQIRMQGRHHSSSTPSDSACSSPSRSSPIHFSSAHSSSTHSNPAHSGSSYQNQQSGKKTPPLRNSKYVNSVLFGKSSDSSGMELRGSGLQQGVRQPLTQKARAKMLLDPRVLIEASSQHAPPLIYVESCLIGVHDYMFASL